MKRSKYIHKFFFNRASYTVGDDFGNSLVMDIDYKGDNFKITVLESRDSYKIRKLKGDVCKVAKDLLIRKSGVNFAEGGSFKTR